MPSLYELPTDLKRKRFLKALTKLGFVIDTKGGKGSHIKATWPKTQKSVTIQDNFRPDVLYEVIKVIEECSGITWEQIKLHLGGKYKRK